ncbi:MAG: tRNA dihydrouridine synthase DusB [Proteocatella sp.]|nr:tRNA dihydrouridine synthase DusB [Proteocatella sp.]MBP8654601.1 tRNA dihydrouridine synthase DusB [Proteocatella sp.]MBP9659262.1 tRNA dihydrouridine synthase DusB [Proteocatella sp.]MBP9967140.1 tRNA dihydrouridine synthase DusB [Proteocatella sp.]NCB71218.1 tRNA dihydrouridine synthase DusB [Clostridia bacterium]
MKIGSFVTQGEAFLAPMAGVTDFPFRVICKRYGASLLYTEMINAKALCYGDENTFSMLEVKPEEGDVAVQIFGHEPQYMAEAASILSDMNRFRIIDINMGCPAPKITKNNEGSALMKDPALAFKIIDSVKKASKLPVTVKFRKGWDDSCVNAVEFARNAQAAGADCITVHGRTREQYYSGKADWDIISEVKKSVSIPVIANGDIFSIGDAVNIIEKTGADAYMIGRGSQGNPFIFSQIRDFIEGSPVRDIPDTEKIDVMLEHYDLSIKYKGEDKTVREMRKHIGWYLKGMYGSARMRDDINHIVDADEVRQMLRDYQLSLTQND